jgi:rhodanese-related sulfurtransferase
MIKPALASTLLAICALSVRAEVVNIDNAEMTRLAAAGAVLVDIRTAPEWKETGVIAGAKLLTFFDEKGRVDAPAWLQQLKSVSKPGQAIVLVCRSGNRTRSAAQFLTQQAGFKTVYHATGGMNAWTREGRPVVAP